MIIVRSAWHDTSKMKRQAMKQRIFERRENNTTTDWQTERNKDWHRHKNADTQTHNQTQRHIHTDKLPGERAMEKEKGRRRWEQVQLAMLLTSALRANTRWGSLECFLAQHTGTLDEAPVTCTHTCTANCNNAFTARRGKGPPPAALIFVWLPLSFFFF